MSNERAEGEAAENRIGDIYSYRAAAQRKPSPKAPANCPAGDFDIDRPDRRCRPKTQPEARYEDASKTRDDGPIDTRLPVAWKENLFFLSPVVKSSFPDGLASV